MNIEITSGIVHSALKIVVYGVEGIGKSTFASKFPDPLFIDTEGSTKQLNVKRMPTPATWQDLQDELTYIRTNKPCKTLVIDTMDWAEQLLCTDICSKGKKSSIEDFGYGQGYTKVKENWYLFLCQLSEIADIYGINVIANCHAIIRKFEQPDEMGSFDKYELKLGKAQSQTSPLTKEWADMVLFANYKTIIVKDGKTDKGKGQGNKRVMYCNHQAWCDAKNRFGLPDYLPFDYNEIKKIVEPDNVEGFDVNVTIKDNNLMLKEKQVKKESKKVDDSPLAKLRKLMIESNVMDEELQKACSMAGYYAEDVPVNDYDPNMIEKELLSRWDNLVKFMEINNIKKSIEF